MRQHDMPMMLGIWLIAAGLLFLVANLGLVGPVGGLVWALLFTLGAGVFLLSYIRNCVLWWVLIPSCTLLGLGALVALQNLAPGFANSGALFLGGISLGFWLIYFTQPARWWAIIPGGALLTVGAIAGLASRISGTYIGALLFYGLALTFGAVFLATARGPRHFWALYSAAVLLALGMIVQASLGTALGVLGPIAMIVFGLYLGVQAIHARWLGGNDEVRQSHATRHNS